MKLEVHKSHRMPFPLDSSEHFQVHRLDCNGWKELEPMKTRRCSFAAVVHKDWLYVIGGDRGGYEYRQDDGQTFAALPVSMFWPQRASPASEI